MSFLRRIAAGGGWLANSVNQTPNYLEGDRCIRPFAILMAVGLSGFSAWEFGTVVARDIGDGRIPRALPGVIIAVALGGFALLMTIGTVVGFVPFVERKRSGAVDAVPTAKPQGLDSVPVYVTGIVEELGGKRRYRNRASTLHRLGPTEIRLDVRPWTWWLLEHRLVRHGGTPALHRRVASARLQPASVSRLSMGTAYLVSGEKPAIRLYWKHGALILAFKDHVARDAVFVEIAGWASPGFEFA